MTEPTAVVAPRSAVAHPHMRARDGAAQETTAVELFFDLVYVLAVTQLSHLLLTHLSWSGATKPRSARAWTPRRLAPSRRQNSPRPP